jgi:APA family basic amino acid/polyamine antiporter
VARGDAARMNDAQRPLGLVAATALVAGNIVGSGIFLLPSALAPYGLMSFAGWAVTLAGALALAGVFARLARAMPKSGGPYVYVRSRFGELAGFFIAWSYWVTIWTAVAAIAIAFAGYAGSAVPALAVSPIASAATALTAIWVCTAINLVSIRTAGWAQTATTVLKLLPLLLVAGVGLAFVDPAALPPVNPGGEHWTGVIAASAALALWSLLGLESASIVAASVRDPARNVPRATLIGTGIAAVVTVFACGVVQLLVPMERLAVSSAPFADAAVALFGVAAGPAVALIAALSCFGALIGWILVQGQFPVAPARDGLLPARFAHCDARGLPRFGIVSGSVLASVLVSANHGGDLVSLFTFAILLSTAATLLPYLACSLVCLAEPRERRSAAALALGGVGAVYSVWALSGIGREALIWGGALLLAGLPWYLLRSRRRAVRGAAT